MTVRKMFEREMCMSFFGSLHVKRLVISSSSLLSFMSRQHALLNNESQFFGPASRRRKGESVRHVISFSGVLFIDVFILNSVHVILHALDIFRSTCIMIVPVQFADVEVWICAFCMSLCVCSTKQDVCF